VVNAVEKGGPADKAGVEPGDVILKFDGKPINQFQ
jgi:serine protease Do